MNLNNVYGTRPDLLPRSMVRLVRGDQPGGRRLIWVGRPGVELLTLEQHLHCERASFGRYPRNSDGTIEWSAVADELVLHSASSESTELSVIIQQFAPSATSLILLWGSLGVPSVKIGMESYASHLAGIMESSPEFWIYSPEDEVVVELQFSGVVTVARVPAEVDPVQR